MVVVNKKKKRVTFVSVVREMNFASSYVYVGMITEKKLIFAFHELFCIGDEAEADDFIEEGVIQTFQINVKFQAKK